MATPPKTNQQTVGVLCLRSYRRGDGFSDGVKPFDGCGVTVGLDKVLTSRVGCNLGQMER